jgi:hypothetical protein
MSWSLSTTSKRSEIRMKAPAMRRLASTALIAALTLVPLAAVRADVPAKFIGAWGRENCSVLVIRFGPRTFASPADGPAMAVSSAVEAGGMLNVTYTSPGVPKPVTDTYAVGADGRLQMLRTSVGGNVVSESHMAPWDHCPK